MLEGWREKTTSQPSTHGREGTKEGRGRKGTEGKEGDLTLYSVYLLSACNISKQGLTCTIQTVITRAILLMCTKIIKEDT